MKFIRSIVGVLFTVAILPVVGEFFVKLAEQAGLYESPSVRWEQIAWWLNWTVDTFYLRYIATCLLGVAIGFSAVAMTRRDNEVSAAELNSIGQRALVLAARIAGQANRPGWRQPEDFDNFLGEIRALLVRMTRAGIHVPEVPLDLNSRDKALVAERFFRAVGPLVRDGSLDEARDVALQFLHDLGQA